MTTLYEKILEAILRNTFRSMATQEDKNASKAVEEICKEEMKKLIESRGYTDEDAKGIVDEYFTNQSKND